MLMKMLYYPENVEYVSYNIVHIKVEQRKQR